MHCVGTVAPCTARRCLGLCVCNGLEALVTCMGEVLGLTGRRLRFLSSPSQPAKVRTDVRGARNDAEASRDGRHSALIDMLHG